MTMSEIRVTWLRAVEHESLGGMEDWLRKRGVQVTQIALYQGRALPLVDSFDLLIMTGGGFFPTDEQHYPWLLQGLELIRDTVLSQRRFLGICLGAQLLGRAFGGEITQNAHMEIGWHPVHLSPQGLRHPLTRDWPSRFAAFHWHQDAVSVPADAEPLASSAGCANQAFAIGTRVLGVQFHPEITEMKARVFVERSPPPGRGPYVQSAEKLFSNHTYFTSQKSLLDAMLRNLLAS